MAELRQHLYTESRNFDIDGCMHHSMWCWCRAKKPVGEKFSDDLPESFGYRWIRTKGEPTVSFEPPKTSHYFESR